MSPKNRQDKLKDQFVKPASDLEAYVYLRMGSVGLRCHRDL